MMLWKRLPYLLPWRRRRAEHDMQEELRTIAEMATPGELGNLTLAAEDARAEWGWTRLEQTAQDIRYAVRSLRKSPGFATTAILSLAIGIGANTSLFTIINAVMWKLLPVTDPDSLLVLRQQGHGPVSVGFTYQQYGLLREGDQVVEELAAYSRAPLNVTIDGSIEPTAEGQLVSGNYFPLLGVRAQRGRLFDPSDDRVPAAHPVAIISDGYWKSRFAQDPQIVGKQISLSGVGFTIVGVTPPEFFGVDVGHAPQLFVPIMMQPVVMPTTHNLLVDRPNLFSTWLRIVGRARPGVSAPEATARLDALAQNPDWQPKNKFTGERERVRLSTSSAATGISDLRDQFSQPLFILMGVVGIVLLVACANTGNLVLARAATRRSEFALRVALGAGRSRLIRQILVEGLVLAGLAGICGTVLAFWATQALVAYASAGRSPIALDLSPDLRVLAFTTAVSALAGLLFGSVPAIRASRSEMTAGGQRDLSTTRRALGGRGPGKALIVSQVALSLVLLVGAGLFVRSLQNLNRHETDVDESRVLVVRVEPRGAGLRGQPGVTERLDRTYRELVENLERIPGVQSASLARTSPLARFTFGFRVMLPSADEPRVVHSLMIYPKYFATMGIPITKGRDFNESDLRPDSPFAVIVNQAFVRKILNGGEPLGIQHGLREGLSRPGSPSKPGQPVNIIGVVRDTRYPALREEPPPTIYQTFLQARTGFGQMVLHVRVATQASDVARQVREAVQAIDKDVPIFELHTLADEVDATLVRERLVATLSGVFGMVALTLIAIGLYGLMAFNVSRRTAEIGIRVALGARRADVRWMIVRQALTVVLTGIAIGVPAAWIAGRLAAGQIAGLLFEITPSDPITIAFSATVLLLVAICASVVPARRAARIDPIVALRSE
jgi:predicted permease